MKTRFAKRRPFLLALGCALWAVAPPAPAQTPLGLKVQMYGATPVAGLSVTGAVGTIFVLEYIPALSATNHWLDVTNLTLTSSPQLVLDPTSAGVGQRFYRAVAVSTNQVLIPAGSFVMGNTFPGGSGTELPLHTNYISAFYMDQYEVTKGLWDNVYHWATNHGYSFDLPGSWLDGTNYSKGPTHPVNTLNWHDCVKWCNARSEQAGRTPAYYTNAAQTAVYRTGQVAVQTNWVKWTAGYRLPTEAEWEKAARGGAAGHRFPWADTDEITHSRANYYSTNLYAYDTSLTRGYHPVFDDGVTPYTNPAGYFAANGYGLYDMAGNVWEWCWDWYASAYYSTSPGTDPRGPASGIYRVFRGGGWTEDALYARASERYGGYPASTFGGGIGFRTVLPAGP